MKEIIIDGKKYLRFERDHAHAFSVYLQTENNIRVSIHLISTGAAWPEGAADVPTMTVGHLLEPANPDDYDRIVSLYRLWEAGRRGTNCALPARHLSHLSDTA